MGASFPYSLTPQCPPPLATAPRERRGLCGLRVQHLTEVLPGPGRSRPTDEETEAPGREAASQQRHPGEWPGPDALVPLHTLWRPRSVPSSVLLPVLKELKL